MSLVDFQATNLEFHFDGKGLLYLHFLMVILKIQFVVSQFLGHLKIS